MSHRCLLSISPLQCYCLLAYQGRRQCLVSSQPWATPPSSFPSTRFVFFLRETKYCQSSAGTPLYTEEGRKGTVGNGHDVSVNSWLSERTRRGIICLSSCNNLLPGGMSCESICSACTICQPGTIFCLVTCRAKCLCFLVMRETNCSACTIGQPGTVFCLVTCAKKHLLRLHDLSLRHSLLPGDMRKITCSACMIRHSGIICHFCLTKANCTQHISTIFTHCQGDKLCCSKLNKIRAVVACTITHTLRIAMVATCVATDVSFKVHKDYFSSTIGMCPRNEITVLETLLPAASQAILCYKFKSQVCFSK